MLFEIIIIYCIFVMVMLLGAYYADLLIKKDVYTRDDLKNVLPFLNEFKNKVAKNYSPAPLFGTLILSSLLGIVIPMISYNIIFNSALFFIIAYFGMPLVVNFLKQSAVIDSSDYRDTAARLIIQYIDVIIFGFGAGLGSSLIYTWGTIREISFIWFALNIIVLTVLQIIKIKKFIF